MTVPRILGIHVPAYKNLSKVWLPWSDGLALIGANGVGKTNLLEALALLIGSDETMALAAERISLEQAPGLSLVVADDGDRMPLEPDERMRPLGETAWGPRSAQLQRDASWWDGSAHDVASEAWSAAVVRYELRRISTDQGGAVGRQFARTLLDPSSPPHKTYRSAGVLQLPDSDQPPAVLQWLPRLRTDDEIGHSLLDAFRRAAPAVAEFAEVLDSSLSVGMAGSAVGQADWFVHEEATRAALAELSRTSSTIEVASLGGDEADWSVAADKHEIGRLGFEPVAERLSAGQRRWLDEAAGTMTRAILSFNLRVQLYTDVLPRVPEDLLEQAVTEYLPELAADLDDGFWSFSTFARVVAHLQPAMAALAVDQHSTDSLSRRLLRTIAPYYAALDPQLVVRVFDEPEAHLHPRAQHDVAAALDSMRHEGANVVVASHSATFVDRPGWSVVQVAGGGIRVVSEKSRHARSSLAHDLGLSSGELLTGVRHLLIVEGSHDQAVLDRFWRDDLRAAGIRVVRMHGTNNLLATAELDFIDQYLDVPMTVMLDNVCTDRVSDPGVSDRSLSQEELKLRDLLRSRGRSRRMGVIGLSRPDIVCYLPEDQVRQLHPRFAGWTTVLADRPQRGDRYKEWLMARYHADLRTLPAVQAVLDLMSSDRVLPGAELVREVNGLLAGTSAST